MPKYEVRLDCGKTHNIEADCVTIDPHQVRFDDRAAAGKPGILKAYFPASRVSHVINKDKKDK